MKQRVAKLTLAVLAALSVSLNASAQTHVEWVQSSGVIGPNEAVEIWLRLSVDPGSAPLILGGTAYSLPGLDLSAFASIDYIFPTDKIYCSTTFFPAPPLNGCFDSASPWRLDFADGSAASFMNSDGHFIGAGQYRDYLLGQFVPQNGPVAAGTYSFSNAALGLAIVGKDAGGQSVFRQYELGQTCSSFSSDCAFTRTVVSVPEPSTLLMLAGGLALLGLARRRQV